jgi:hypothetical protein
MITLISFIETMSKNLDLQISDIIENINDINEINEYIISLDDNTKNKLNQKLNKLLDDDNIINNQLKIINPDDNINKNFKIALAKLQLKTFLNKYNNILLELNLIDGINGKLSAVINTLSNNLNNKYNLYYKYIKYKNKYLQLKYIN